MHSQNNKRGGWQTFPSAWQPATLFFFFRRASVSIPLFFFFGYLRLGNRHAICMRRQWRDTQQTSPKTGNRHAFSFAEQQTEQHFPQHGNRLHFFFFRTACVSIPLFFCSLRLGNRHAVCMRRQQAGPRTWPTCMCRQQAGRGVKHFLTRQPARFFFPKKIFY